MDLRVKYFKMYEENFKKPSEFSAGFFYSDIIVLWNYEKKTFSLHKH